MRRLPSLRSFALGAALASGAATADVPFRMHLQGMLSNGGGGVTQPTVSLDLAVYTVETGGAPVWSETLTGVALDQGRFSITVGKKVPLDPDLFAGGQAWLGISVDGQPELPRSPLSSVAFAFQAAYAGLAEDVSCDACVDGAVLEPGSVGLDRLLGQGCLPGDVVVADVDGFVCGPGDGFLLSADTAFGGDVTGTAGSLQIAAGAVDTTALAQAVADALVPPGAVMAFAGATPPPGWLLCDGATVSRALYPRLFAAIGVGYGSGDGVATFGLPDLRGRAVLGAGQGPGLTARPLGAAVGAESVTLTAAQLPPHQHDGTTADAGAHTHTASSGLAGEHAHTASTGAAGAHAHTGTVASAGDHTHAVGNAGDHTHTMGAAGDHAHSYLRLLFGNDVDRGNGSSVWSIDATELGTTGTAGSHTHSIGSAGLHVHSLSVDGAHTHGLTIAPVADHTHTVSVAAAGSHAHTVTVDAAAAHHHTFTTSVVGGGASVPTVPPAVALGYIIKY